MVFEHDFKLFPELTNNQLNFYYFDSPHTQITEDFSGVCVDVHDGDTIKVKWNQRTKPIIIRLDDIAAPELNEKGGDRSQNWLEGQILGDRVDIILSEERVERWGRILGQVIHKGINMNYQSLELGFSIPFDEQPEPPIEVFSI